MATFDNGARHVLYHLMAEQGTICGLLKVFLSDFHVEARCMKALVGARTSGLH